MDLENMTQEEMLAHSSIGKEDIQIGQEYFGAKVVHVTQEVEESDGYYHIKRTITLDNDMMLLEQQRRRTSQGVVVSKEYGLDSQEVEVEEEKPKEKKEKMICQQKPYKRMGKNQNEKLKKDRRY